MLDLYVGHRRMWDTRGDLPWSGYRNNPCGLIWIPSSFLFDRNSPIWDGSCLDSFSPPSYDSHATGSRCEYLEETVGVLETAQSEAHHCVHECNAPRWIRSLFCQYNSAGISRKVNHYPQIRLIRWWAAKFILQGKLSQVTIGRMFFAKGILQLLSPLCGIALDKVSVPNGVLALAFFLSAFGIALFSSLPFISGWEQIQYQNASNADPLFPAHYNFASYPFF